MAKRAIVGRAVKESWLIFIDTNIFLDFYRLGGESAGRQLEALERHKNSIITGEQVRMEFLKNRQKVIADALQNLSKPSKIAVPSVILGSNPVRSLTRANDTAIRMHKAVLKRVERIMSNPIAHDPVLKVLSRIFRTQSKFNLSRLNKERFSIRTLARKRWMLGYPPRKKADTSIGDAINWEWIIKCAQSSDPGCHVLIVSRDGDYGISYGGEDILNDWLRAEFKERVGRKRRIELTQKLTSALKKLEEVVKPEDESEEKRVLASWATHHLSRWHGAVGDDQPRTGILQALLENILAGAANAPQLESGPDPAGDDAAKEPDDII